MKSITTTKRQIQPVYFDDRIVALTPGQKNILDLLIHHTKNRTSIENEHIVECYIKSVSESGKQKRIGNHKKNGKETFGEYTITLTKYSQGINQKARQWFKANLGSCVIKGRILVVPVINFGE